MALEIEHKFLVDVAKIPVATKTIKMVQGYVPSDPLIAVRVRIEGDVAKLAVKAKKSELTRFEYEYEIPMADAVEMLENVCQKPFIEKVRHIIEHKGHTWEVDFFERENIGLVLAEIEVKSEEEVFELPDWVTREVTDKKEYRNNYLGKHPYKDWTSDY